MQSLSKTTRPLTRFTAIAIGFHWLLGLMIVASLIFGVYMADLPFSPARIKLFNWHKWEGMTILALSVLRLLWRLTHTPPPSLLMPTWQKKASSSIHLLMYFLFFAVPLVGWAYSSAAGFQVVYFGVVPLPDWVARDADLAGQLKILHKVLAYGLATLLVLHVAAAVKHQLIDKDGLLARMSPFAR